MEGIAQPIIDFITAHAIWAGPAMFVVCFGESLVFVSLFLPGTSVLFIAGTLLPAGTLPSIPVALGAIAGAVAGDGPISQREASSSSYATAEKASSLAVSSAPSGQSFRSPQASFACLRDVFGPRILDRPSCGRPRSSFLPRSSAKQRDELSLVSNSC
jgi:hypothetical protein